jgi:hypothetical protein
MTVPEAHEPPLIENAPDPTVRVIIGAAVRVSGPAFTPVPVLLTVIVPVFVVVFPGVVVNADTGALNAAVPTVVVPVSATV